MATRGGGIFAGFLAGLRVGFFFAEFLAGIGLPLSSDL
jgi:hypothetical protein